MAGHSKWAQIKRKKAATDAARSKLFGKLSRLIAVASKKASGDVHAPLLRAAIEKAKAENMPNDAIERAVKKGVGADAGTMEEILYEAYGPGGCALLIETLTDNKNRTAQEIRHVLLEHGASLAAPGSAIWAFEKKDGARVATTAVPLSPNDEATLSALLSALDEHDDVQEVYTNAM